MSVRNRYHVLMGEIYGWLSGWALVQIAKHASKARDVVTVYRVREIIRRGVEIGWSDTGADDGKIVPGRDLEVAERVMAYLKEAKPS